ncbi:MAG: hypothetical protein JW760_10415 [Spirochaetales bacterium]|nr:hypothetical protein [Spirochaetales bacterium]
MVQFYFLSILISVLGGLVLASDRLKGAFPVAKAARDYLDEKPTVKLIFALAAVVVGILKLLSATKGDTPVVGDLLPVLAGWAVGVVLFLEYYSVRNDMDETSMGTPTNVLVRNKTIIGIAAAVIGLVHFFIPGVLFL